MKLLQLDFMINYSKCKKYFLIKKTSNTCKQCLLFVQPEVKKS